MSEMKNTADTDISSIMKKHDAIVKEGKLSVSDGKYYVTIDNKKNELDLQTVISSQPIQGVIPAGVTIDAKVIVATDNSILAIIFKKIPIICYKPIPALRKAIDESVRDTVINTMVLEGRLPAELGKELKRER